jgi:WD40 repeat protein
MFVNLMEALKQPLKPHWEGQVDEYVSAIDWGVTGETVAIGDASGAIYLFDLATLTLRPLESGQGKSVDCLKFSHDGEFLAAAGQAGQVDLWHMQPEPQQLTTLPGNGWIDRLAWSPRANQLAFQSGFDVNIWDAAQNTIIHTLKLGGTATTIAWHPTQPLLAIAVKDQIRIWQTKTWQEQTLLTGTAPIACMGWSPDGEYLAAGLLDRSTLIWDEGNTGLNQSPWQAEGYPGVVKHLVWADQNRPNGSPVLVLTSAEGIVIWEKTADGTDWETDQLEQHEESINAIGFQPNTFLLASAAGKVILWPNLQAAGFALTIGATASQFTTLTWHPQGQYLMAGGQQGKLRVWAAA